MEKTNQEHIDYLLYLAEQNDLEKIEEYCRKYKDEIDFNAETATGVNFTEEEKMGTLLYRLFKHNDFKVYAKYISPEVIRFFIKQGAELADNETYELLRYFGQPSVLKRFTDYAVMLVSGECGWSPTGDEIIDATRWGVSRFEDSPKQKEYNKLRFLLLQKRAKKDFKRYYLDKLIELAQKGDLKKIIQYCKRHEGDIDFGYGYQQNNERKTFAYVLILQQPKIPQDILRYLLNKCPKLTTKELDELFTKHYHDLTPTDLELILSGVIYDQKIPQEKLDVLLRHLGNGGFDSEQRYLMAKKLVEAGADVHAFPFRRLLHDKENLDLIKYLHEKGVKLEAGHLSVNVPFDIKEYYFQNGVSPNTYLYGVDVLGEEIYPFYDYLEAPFLVKLVDFYVGYGYNINQPMKKGGNTILGEVCAMASNRADENYDVREVVLYLMDKGADPTLIVGDKKLSDYLKESAVCCADKEFMQKFIKYEKDYAKNKAKSQTKGK